MKLLIVRASAQAYTLLCILGQIRIIRGFDASIEEFPYQAHIEVTLKTGDMSGCDASLIATDWLMTAAHCFYGGFKATVYLGTTSRFIDASSRTLRARRIIIHPYFNEYTLENDIALIKIPAVTLTKRIGIVELPKMNADYTDYEVFTPGWDRTENSTLLKVLSNESCLKNKIAEQGGMLCAAINFHSGLCIWDSGAPLVLANTITQVGIYVTRSDHDCSVGSTVIYTPITHYLQWIKDIRNFYQ